MYINKFFAFSLALILAACGIAPKSDSMRDMYGMVDTDTPTALPDVAHMSSTTKPHKIAVLLPLSGDNAPAGRAIESAVTMAVLQNAPDTLSVTFHDTANDINTAISNANGAEIFIGPLFADNARTVRNKTNIPTLSFTSDATAIGDALISASLMPTASVDAIVTQMAADNVPNFVILAPDNVSGKLMAGAARDAADAHDMDVSGIFFYTDGDTESIKSATAGASMNAARSAANNRAREILSDILTNERLTAGERANLDAQMERISRTDTLGTLPYKGILLLGGGADAKTIASFLRYYGVDARDATIYGTALWDGNGDALYDVTLSGARFAALPEIDPTFSNKYQHMTGAAPSRLAAFGYDATNMAVGMLYSGGGNTDYLTQPGGFIGANGLVRLTDNGTNERTLRILELNGTGTPRVIANAKSSFSEFTTNVNPHRTSPAAAMELKTPGVNPIDFINIPERFRGDYRGKTYGANMPHPDTAAAATDTITILPEDDSDPITTPDFESAKRESVTRALIDSVEIEE